MKNAYDRAFTSRFQTKTNKTSVETARFAGLFSIARSWFRLATNNNMASACYSRSTRQKTDYRK